MGVPNTPVCTTQKGLHLGKHNEHISETLILENILQGQPGSNQQNIFFLSPKVGSSRILLPEWLHMLNYVKTVFSYPSTPPPLSNIFSVKFGRWEPLFLESFWVSILGTTFFGKFLGFHLGNHFFGQFLGVHFGNHFFGKFLGFHFGNHFFWKVFELPFWEPLFWKVFGLPFWEPLFLESCCTNSHKSVESR